MFGDPIGSKKCHVRIYQKKNLKAGLCSLMVGGCCLLEVGRCGLTVKDGEEAECFHKGSLGQCSTHRPRSTRRSGRRWGPQ